MAKKVVARTKAKKKRWYPILASKLFDERFIGEAYVTDPDELVGRSLSINMMEITGNPRTQQVNLQFQIREVKENKAYTFSRGFEMVPSAVKRYVRKGRDRIDDSFLVRTKEGFSVRVKPMIITTSNTTNPVLKKIRRQAKEIISTESSKNAYSDLLEAILKSELQKSLKEKLAKTYPIKNVEIRVWKLIDRDKSPEEKSSEKPKEKAQVKEEAKADKSKESSKKESKPEEKKAPAKKSAKKETKEADEKEEAAEEKSDSKKKSGKE